MTGPATKVAELLERHLGLAAGSVGDRVIEAALRRRMEATGHADPAGYLRQVADDRRELGDLVEAVIVPETWFFRYPESFRHLARWAAGRLAAVAGRPVRVLSVPCSTGEEAYSIACTLLAAGVPARVEAVDVSRRAVEVAAAGAYPARAFRDPAADPEDLRGRYFAPTAGGFSAGPEVRRAVGFRAGNLADPQFLTGEPEFDAVFCRNLFIYLTGDARRTAAATIGRLLAPGGVVFMGHAEPLGLVDPGFRSVGPPQAFAFARADRPTEPRSGRMPTPPGRAPVPPSGRPRPTGGSSTVHAPLPDRRPTLADARAAADRGDLAGAAALVERIVRDDGPSAAALTLLGAVHATAGDVTAADRAFTQALYLDPGHYDALIHMMALAQNRGDPAAAANYRRRADAAARREGKP